MRHFILGLALCFTTAQATAATGAREIPRRTTKEFFKEAIFKGGERQLANLETIRVAGHPTFERWVFDFSDAATRTVGKLAPEFLLTFHPAEISNNLADQTESRGKFQLRFRRIEKNFITLEMAKKIAAKSRYLESVLLYPILEEGDCGIEMVLRPGVAVQFQPHQPQSPSGKLVIDIKPL